MDKPKSGSQPTQLNRFTGAVRTAGLTSLAALILGMSFVFLAKYYGLLEKEHLGLLHYLLGIFLEHVGIGLIVSSIAVFVDSLLDYLTHSNDPDLARGIPLALAHMATPAIIRRLGQAYHKVASDDAAVRIATAVE